MFNTRIPNNYHSDSINLQSFAVYWYNKVGSFFREVATLMKDH